MRRVLIIASIVCGAGLFGLVHSGYSFKQGKPVKNLQVLPFTDTRETMRYMTKQSKELGVRCSYCHDVKDYSADTKPEKVIARDMIRMTKILNEQGFFWDDAPEVTCYVCHRGKVEVELELPPRTGARKEQ